MARGWFRRRLEINFALKLVFRSVARPRRRHRLQRAALLPPACAAHLLARMAQR
jgi:hypothetical protein